MDSLYDRCRTNKLIFTKLRPQTSPECTDDNRSLNGGPRNTELEEIFSRRSSAAATRLTSTRRHPTDGDGGELDSDLDECRSEIGSEVFSEVSNVTRRNPKLNRLMHLIQSDKPASPTSPESTKSPETPNVTLVPTEPNESMASIKSAATNSRVNKLCGNFYWNLVTIISVAFGFVFTELVLKQTVKLLKIAKVWIEYAGNYLWNNFIAPVGSADGGQAKVFGKQWGKPGAGSKSVDNVLLVALVIPAVLVLAVVYAIVWVLYFLNVILLTEIPLF